MHLYLHVPFCKQACHYCDFHFSTNQRGKRELVTAMAREIDLRHTYLTEAAGTSELQTIYFGGGTPSLLTEAELAHLFEAIHRHFTVAPTAEITLEANPDDLADPAQLAMFRRYVNRLSIGIQTFDEETLHWMNRAHNAADAAACVPRARDAGFDNLSIDLIYGMSDRIWATDLAQAIALDVPHLSAYNLTIEPDTAFSRWVEKGTLAPVDEALSANQFTELAAAMHSAGYGQYEISSFAKEGHYARHNTAYWQRKPYLGIGPSAHSFNGHSRQANVPNNALYVKELAADNVPADREELTRADRINEYLLTGLRTTWGCQLAELDALLGEDRPGTSFLTEQADELAKLTKAGWLTMTDNTLRLTESGKLFADRVASELFVE